LCEAIPREDATILTLPAAASTGHRERPDATVDISCVARVTLRGYLLESDIPSGFLAGFRNPGVLVPMPQRAVVFCADLA
jgi:hypothetical protein